MFQVLCIDASNDPVAFDICDLIENEIYTVVQIVNETVGKFGIDTEECYILLEKGPEWGYASKRFAPISDINETEFERNYNLQKA